MPEIYIISGIILTLLFSAFFSGIEIAFLSADRLHIELQASRGVLSARIISGFTKNPAMFIGTTLVGNTISLVMYGTFMASALEPFLSQHMNNVSMMIVETVVSTIIVLATAEFLPKSVFLVNPNRMLMVFGVTMRIITWIMWIPVWMIVSLSKFIIVKVFRSKYSDEKPVFGITDLNNYFKEVVNSRHGKNSNDPEVDTEILHNALEFKSIKVRECAIPRTDLVAVDVEDDISVLKKAFIDSGYTKILVYKENIDDIVGYCHSSYLFKKPKDIKSIVTPIIHVPETKLANELLIEFISKHRSIAVVLDEFGGTAGIVTIEDIIEQIFGDINDEHDTEDLVEQKISENVFLFSARHDIDYLNDEYDLNLPTGDFNTLGGLILSLSGDIPVVNDIIEDHSFRFIIKSVDGIKIDKVQLVKLGGSDA